MGWTNDAITELIAPNTVTFAPGNNVVGFGATLPSELTAAGFVDAIVFYSTEWNAANVTPTIKFRFIATSSSGMSIGYGICSNPSVSQTATVVSAELLRTPGGSYFGTEIRNASNSPVFYLVDDGGGSGITGNGGLMDILDSAGFARIRAQANSAGTTAVFGIYDTGNNQRIGLAAANSGNTSITVRDSTGVTDFAVVSSTTQTQIQAFNAVLAVPSSSTYIQTNTPLEWDTAWQAIPLVNGWFGDATRVPLYRMMADGTTQFKGVILKNSVPLNGEQWMNAIPAIYTPLHTWSFLTPTPGRTYNGSQVVEIHTDGTGVIYDMSNTQNGVISLDNVRYTSQY